jgi:hypothetical protein
LVIFYAQARAPRKMRARGRAHAHGARDRTRRKFHAKYGNTPITLRRRVSTWREVEQTKKGAPITETSSRESLRKSASLTEAVCMKSARMIYYVYALFAPWDPALAFPRYIGKGCGLRAFCPPRQRVKDVQQWIAEELGGREPLFDLLAATLFEDEALSLEADLIALYGRECDGGVLLN